jgi:hypothetical protein
MPFRPQYHKEYRAERDKRGFGKRPESQVVRVRAITEYERELIDEEQIDYDRECGHPAKPRLHNKSLAFGECGRISR